MAYRARRLDPLIAFLPLFVSFAMLVCAPLALRATRPGGSTGRLLFALCPPAALLGIVALAVPEGAVAAGIALGWLVFTALAALHGLTRVLAREGRRIEELAIASGFAYLAVGGAWVVLWRAGLRIGDLGEHVPLLTSIHFHHAGFVSPILVGLAGRELRALRTRFWPLYVWAAAVVIAGPALVALGIAAVRAIEAPAAMALALGTAVAAGCAALLITRPGPSLPRLLLSISCGSAFVAMALAYTYASGNAVGAITMGIEEMARWHGVTNAVGYVLCGLLSWNLRASRETAPRSTSR